MPSKTVLIVEDDAGVREALRDDLVDEGFTVLTAEHGARALEVLSVNQVDIILCDIMMSVLDGYGFRTVQLMDPKLAGIPIIFMTAVPDTRKIESMKPHGVIRKPFAIESFLQFAGALVPTS